MFTFLTSLCFKTWIQFARLLNPDRRNALNILMLGGHGAGKGTMAQKLSDSTGLPHLSSGHLIRREIANHTDFGQRWAQHVAEGRFVPDSAMFQIMIPELDLPKYNKGVIFDGFPRTVAQAKALRRILAARGNQVDIAVYLKVSQEDVTERLALRRTCSNPECTCTYHLKFNPPKEEGKCDVCHSPLVQREDDRPERIAVRIAEFNRTFEPLRRYYEKLGLLVTIESTNAEGIDEVFEKVAFAVEEVE